MREQACTKKPNESSPNSLEQCLMTYQNFLNNFGERSLKEHFCEIISKPDQRFQRRRFFKEFLHVCIMQKTQFIRAMFIEKSKFHAQF